MADKAHAETDAILADMEKHLSAIYTRAGKENQKKARDFFKQFNRLDKQHKADVQSGKWTEEQYQEWKKNKMLYSQRFNHLKEQISADIVNTNKTALNYINNQLPEVYAINYNALDGEIAGYSFELTDAETVKNLATTDKSLLPYKELDETKDIRWNTKHINAEVLQGILQGDSMDEIAKRFQKVTNMDEVAAIRNARTTVTGAENIGRLNSYKQAQKDGIRLQKEWLATNDGRTRHAHALLNGQVQDVDKPFKSEFGDIMFPADPTAHPANVYNCRCTLISKFLGFGKDFEKKERTVEKEEKPKENKIYKPTKEELKAAEWYVSGEGQWINQFLRGNMENTISSDEKQAINALERLTESAEVKQKTLYRSVDAQAVFGKMSAADYEDLQNTLIYNEKSKENLVNNTIGKEITEKGFMSTTKNQQIAAGWGDFTGSDKPIVMEFNVPKGTKGFDMKQFEIEGQEQEEILLAKNQKYKIKSVESKKVKLEDEYGEYDETVVYVKADIL